MIAHICLYKLKPAITLERLEEMMSLTRVRLLRVPEALARESRSRKGTRGTGLSSWRSKASINLRF